MDAHPADCFPPTRSRSSVRIILLVGIFGCASDPPVTVAELVVVERVVATFDGPDILQSSWIVMPAGGQRVVVAHRRHLTILDTFGIVTARFGREGAGPGEFLASPYLGTIGDSVWTADRPLGRLTVIHAGDLGYRMDVLPFNGGKPDNASFAWGALKGMLGDGRSLASALKEPPAGSPPGVVHILARALRPDSLEQIMLSDLMTEDCIIPQGERFVVIIGCQRVFHLVAPDGRSATAVVRDRDVEGGMAFRLTRVSVVGDTQMTATVSVPARRFTAGLRDTLIANASRTYGFPVDGSGFNPPKYLGSIWFGHQGNDGSLWLQASRPPYLPQLPNLRQWYLVDPDGTLVGGFRIDIELTLGAVSRDAAWAVRDREDGRAELVRITVKR